MSNYRTRVDSSPFTNAGLQVQPTRDGAWVLDGYGLRIHYWPTTCTAFVFGKSFRVRPDALVAAVKAGRIGMPRQARPNACRSCGDQIWWLPTVRHGVPTGKKMPVNRDGESHWSTCPTREQHQRSRERREVEEARSRKPHLEWDNVYGPGEQTSLL